VIPSSSDLSYFIEVANTLNISRAAERLGISQPSLSLAIKRLEDALGVGLLVRGKSGVQLTRAGQKFTTQARLLVGEWEKLADEAKRDEEQVGGRYVIGCHPSVALFTLPSFVAKLMHSHDELELKLVHGLSRQITDDVINFKVDFGLVVNPVEHPDLVIKTLSKDEVGLWGGPDGGAAAKAQSGDGILICDPELIQTQALLKQLKRKDFGFRRTITTSNLEVIASLTGSGAGVGILPGRVAQREPHLKLKALAGLPRYQDKLCLVYRADAQRSSASRRVAELIAGALAERNH
jgi:DNA-binding transcriptional LysR family regulator